MFCAKHDTTGRLFLCGTVSALYVETTTGARVLHRILGGPGGVLTCKQMVILAMAVCRCPEAN